MIERSSWCINTHWSSSGPVCILILGGNITLTYLSLYLHSLFRIITALTIPGSFLCSHSWIAVRFRLRHSTTHPRCTLAKPQLAIFIRSCHFIDTEAVMLMYMIIRHYSSVVYVVCELFHNLLSRL